MGGWVHGGDQPELPFVSRDTSEAAALAAEPNAETLRAAVLAFIRACGDHGATDEEIQVALQMGGNTQRPRRRELHLRHLIRESGETRMTRSNRRAVVWVKA